MGVSFITPDVDCPLLELSRLKPNADKTVSLLLARAGRVNKLRMVSL